MKQPLFIPLILLFFLAGCASMDKSECLTADWRTIGFEDGVAGENVTNIAEYRKDCAKHGVSPVLDDYQRGHLDGSKLFCTKRNGFEQGNGGKGYSRSCPADLEGTFLDGYRDGQELFSLRKIMESSLNSVSRAEYRINRIDDLSAEKSELMIADGLVREQRAQLREEIDQLRYEQFELQEQLPELRGNAQTAVANYQEAEQRFNDYLDGR